MHPDLVNELTYLAEKRGLFITIETEGSHFIETDYPLGLISLSPKFSLSFLTENGPGPGTPARGFIGAFAIIPPLKILGLAKILGYTDWSRT